MTTSPSWFDQEKFARLIKKVGSKTSSGQLPTAFPTQARKAPPAAASAPASTPTISLASKPDLPLSASQALPTLPKRPAPAPVVKPIFTYDAEAQNAANMPKAVAPSTESPKVSAAVQPNRAKETPKEAAPPVIDKAVPAPEVKPSGQGEVEALQKVTVLDGELSRVKEELEQARTESVILREQLRQAEQITDDRAALVAQIDELSQTSEQLENTRLAYADLREIYETLKREMGRPREEQESDHAELQQQIEVLQQQLAEQEAINLQMNTAGMEEVAENLKLEVSALQEQVGTLQEQANTLQEQEAQAREEVSTAQRALALSQKTLQETRDALREATEGSSMTKGNLDNLKSECATLVQQNMLLQAQLDQVSRELSAAKAKQAARG